MLSRSFCTAKTLTRKVGSGVTPSSLKITTWNVNGIRAVINKGMLQELISQQQPDILCLSETRIDPLNYLKSNIQTKFISYNHYLNHSRTKNGYSGVAVLTKALPIRVYDNFGGYTIDQDLTNEGRIITLEYDKFFLVNTYKPNAGPELGRLLYKTRFDLAFNHYISQLNKSKPTIAVGDFNLAPQLIDMAKSKLNEGSAGFTPLERQLFKELIEAGMIDAYRLKYPEKIEYTWWSTRRKCRQKNIGWRMDQILVQDRLREGVDDVKILGQVYGSDHCPVQLTIDFDRVQPSQLSRV